MGYNTTITNEGAALLASVIATQGTITFSEMRFSDTDYTGSEATLTEGTFGGTFVTASAAASVVDSTTIRVAASFNNSGITSAHPLYSIGVIGTDGNDTALIAVCTTDNPEATIRPPVPATSISTYAFNTNLSVSSTSNITVAGTTAAALYETDVVDSLVSTATNKPLSANQGRVLKGNIDDNFSGQSNDNLLLNPFFTVNQRGFTSGAISSYNTKPTVDMWLGSHGSGAGAGVLSKTTNGMHFTPSGGSIRLYQIPTDPTVFDGKTLTFSIYYAKGNSSTFDYLSGTINNFDSSVNSNFYTGGVTDCIQSLSYVPAYTSFMIFVALECTITAVKLEFGSKSTLKNDIESNQTLETLKCQKADFSQVAYQNLDATTARKAYSAGQYFFNADGELCRAKTAILSGATLTEGTNFEKKTVGEELAGDSGTFTLTYSSGTYTGGITSQNNYYNRVGNLVFLHGEVTLSGTPDSSHSYANFSGLPFTGKYGSKQIQGNARIENNNKLTSCAIPNGQVLALYFNLADGTFPTSGQVLSYSIIYEI